MSPSELLGTFLTGVLAVAIISLILAPKSKAADVISAFGTNFAGVINSAKSYPQ